MKRSQKTNLVRAEEMILQSISTIAMQLISDIGHIYQRPVQGTPIKHGSMSSPEIAKNIDSLVPGEILLVAARRSELTEAFCMELVQHIALQLGQPVTLFGTPKPVLNFARSLIDSLANISPDTSIYDGRLTGDESERLSAVLSVLRDTKIFVNSGKYIDIDCLYETASKHEQQHAGSGLMIVNNAQHIYYGGRLMDAQSGMCRLKELSGKFKTQMIALYPLDDTVDLPDYLLTRGELAEMEKLSVITDKIMLLCGEPMNLQLQRPMIPKPSLVR